jgi:hypothetical protein
MKQSSFQFLMIDIKIRRGSFVSEQKSVDLVDLSSDEVPKWTHAADRVC